MQCLLPCWLSVVENTRSREWRKIGTTHILNGLKQGNVMKINSKILANHQTCEVYVDTAPTNRHGQPITTHAAALRCRCHNTWLKWVSVEELEQLNHLDVEII